MEAKTWRDTVMSFVAISDASSVVFGGEEDEAYHTHKRVAKIQAAITWSARQPEIEEARKAGIREVVEFYKQEQIYAYGYPLLLNAHWQTKLKEWGIEK